MNTNILRITFAAIFIFTMPQLGAMNWPTRDAALIRNFGWNNMGSPVLGMVFSGGTEVLAAEAGEIIFSRRPGDTASRLPSPLGLWTAVDHGDGLISIYSRYREHIHGELVHGEEIRRSTHIERQEPVAISGISGWSNRTGFYFMLFDRRERRWINPAMLITPVHNTQPFQILGIHLVNAQGTQLSGAQLLNLTQGRYRITVATTDNIDRAANNFLAPSRIIGSINGIEVGSLNLESIFARDGILMMQRNGLVPTQQIYSPFPAFEVADVFLSRGRASLEIIIQDMAGNTRRALTQMIIN